jgi:hypothetical protein
MASPVDTAHSSSGLGHLPLKEETTGSNPVCATSQSPALTGMREMRYGMRQVISMKNTKH